MNRLTTINFIREFSLAEFSNISNQFEIAIDTINLEDFKPRDKKDLENIIEFYSLTKQLIDVANQEKAFSDIDWYSYFSDVVAISKWENVLEANELKKDLTSMFSFMKSRDGSNLFNRPIFSVNNILNNCEIDIQLRKCCLDFMYYLMCLVLSNSDALFLISRTNFIYFENMFYKFSLRSQKASQKHVKQSVIRKNMNIFETIAKKNLPGFASLFY